MNDIQSRGKKTLRFVVAVLMMGMFNSAMDQTVVSAAIGQIVPETDTIA
ncbi:hypothetical protein ACFP7A_05640 [Sporolactobacillus kofuensis]|uniref:MFS transporter n=1 Tax=Sporolactobacillus kofuensis TaxID=269672 RepID=A0ABW1WFX4_9BACL|nr:hypothetical protein [Sporolactobacillus kofuensis]MCO7175170.1 hypothetical protein [Sporolactobacillus kofuensis]